MLWEVRISAHHVADGIGRGLSPRGWLTLCILTTFGLLSFLDKIIFALLINPMGSDLNLSDVQIGIIQGLAFSAFYCGGTLIVGAALDRYSPRLFLFFLSMLWSFCAAASGLAAGFISMFVARAGVGLGESVVSPVAYSVIARSMPRDRLAFATGVFSTGNNIGGVVAMIFGGAIITRITATDGLTLPLLGHLAPWQAAFIVTGLPGVFIAFLAFLLPRLSRAQAATPAEQDKSRPAGFGRFVLSNFRLVACYLGAASLFALCAYAMISWSAAYAERAFQWPASKVGIVLGAGLAAGGFANVLWGSVADRVRRAGVPEGLYVVYFCTAALGIPFTIIAFTTSSEWVFIIFNTLAWIFLCGLGAFPAAQQLFTPPEFIGRMSGVQTFTYGLLAIGLAPVLVSLLTQYVYGDPAKVGYSIATTVAGCGGLACILLIVGRKPFREAVEREDRRRDLAQ